VPKHKITQAEAKAAVQSLFSGKIPDLDRLLTIFDHSRIEHRNLLMPLDWYLQTHSPAERNRVFLEQGMELLRRSAENCLHAADMSPAQVDHVIYVNSTGLATPTLDARLINDLGCRPQTTRLPIWGLGCAAGAAGLSRAWDYCQAHPRARVLLTALECCSLTLVSQDLSIKNLIGTSLFADGAATVLVTGDDVARRGPEIIASRSELFPESYRIMGWDICDDGMELVLSPELPALIMRELPELVERFLQECGLEGDEIRHYLMHPGGARVIDACKEVLGLAWDDLALTVEMLRDYGNLSSVSVLVVLEKWLASVRSEQAGYGLLAAFGPGFSAELLLLRV
jgi:alkylresorcinol/alkylpyrone synthase